MFLLSDPITLDPTYTPPQKNKNTSKEIEKKEYKVKGALEIVVLVMPIKKVND
jgi:hypothetical protein